jgi:pimeloyl-ACP methyl ester carboxylesterase
MNDTKPPLLLLAGLLCDLTIWEPVAARLEDIADVHILSFSGLRSIGAMAETVLAGSPPVFALAGHSMGGRVALEIFAQAPARVSRLALLNTGVHPMAPQEPGSRGRLTALARDEGMAALAAAWLPPMMSPHGLADAALMERLSAMVLRSTPESFADQIQALLDRPDARAVLPLIDVPTLLLSGTEDRWSPLAQHEDMQREIAEARLVAITDAGHMAPVEKPAAVAAALRGWLQGDKA